MSVVVVVVGDEDGSTSVGKMKNWIQLAVTEKDCSYQGEQQGTRGMVRGIKTGRKQTKILQQALGNILRLAIILQSSNT